MTVQEVREKLAYLSGNEKVVRVNVDGSFEPVRVDVIKAGDGAQFILVTSDVGVDEGHCPKRDDEIHCDCWWDGGKPCCACGHNGGADE